MSPTQRTLKRYRELGYHCEVTEKWIPGANIRKDLWGFCDILCLKGEEVLAVQACHYTDISKRVAKITNSDHVDKVREANIGIEVIGWHKPKFRYKCKVVDLS